MAFTSAPSVQPLALPQTIFSVQPMNSTNEYLKFERPLVIDSFIESIRTSAMALSSYFADTIELNATGFNMKHFSFTGTVKATIYKPDLEPKVHGNGTVTCTVTRNSDDNEKYVLFTYKGDWDTTGLTGGILNIQNSMFYTEGLLMVDGKKYIANIEKDGKAICYRPAKNITIKLLTDWQFDAEIEHSNSAIRMNAKSFLNESVDNQEYHHPHLSKYHTGLRGHITSRRDDATFICADDGFVDIYTTAHGRLERMTINNFLTFLTDSSQGKNACDFLRECNHVQDVAYNHKRDISRLAKLAPKSITKVSAVHSEKDYLPEVMQPLSLPAQNFIQQTNKSINGLAIPQNALAVTLSQSNMVNPNSSPVNSFALPSGVAPNYSAYSPNHQHNGSPGLTVSERKQMEFSEQIRRNHDLRVKQNTLREKRIAAVHKIDWTRVMSKSNRGLSNDVCYNIVELQAFAQELGMENIKSHIKEVLCQKLFEERAKYCGMCWHCQRAPYPASPLSTPHY